MVIIGVILLGFVGLYFLAAICAVIFQSRTWSVAAGWVMGGSAIIIILGLIGGLIYACLRGLS